MIFLDKIKQSAVIVTVMITMLFFMCAFYEESFDIETWSRRTKFLANGVAFLSVIYCIAYFTEKKE